ncbi:hypothetical protein ABIB90_008461 [Bradyrhizobium sp. JR4.1]|uniref:hypothetical protein n=1 Tax=Bradyrhizobium sp. JR4.1 TaxID=3156372 RepID=UPI003398A578
MKPFGEIEWEKRRPDARDPYIVKRVTWSWLTAELVQIRPTELEYRVKADAAYLALHDFLRADGETIIDGRIRSTLLDIQDTLTFVPAGSFVEGWNRFKSRTSSVVAVHLSHLALASKATDVSEIPPSLYFENESLRATLLKLRSVLDGSSIVSANFPAPFAFECSDA